MTGTTRDDGKDDPGYQRWVGWLDAALSWRWAFIGVGCATLLARQSGTSHEAHVIGQTLGAGLTALLLVRRRRIGQLVAAMVVTSGICFARPEALGLEPARIAERFAIQEPGQGTLLFVRVVLLCLAIIRIRAKGKRETAGLAVVGLFFIASIVCRGLFLPYALVAAFVTAELAERRARPVHDWQLLLVAVVPMIALVVHAKPTSALLPPPASSDAEGYWRLRGNLYRAHAAALAWAEHEDPPAQGHLALAEIDHDLGDSANADQLIRDLEKHAADDELRREAEEDSARWQAER